LIYMKFFYRNLLTVLGILGSRFQKRFLFQPPNRTRTFGSPWTAADERMRTRRAASAREIPSGRQAARPAALLAPPIFTPGLPSH
jgi:hypothetical protein